MVEKYRRCLYSTSEFLKKPKKREKKLISVLIYRIKAKTPKLIR